MDNLAYRAPIALFIYKRPIHLRKTLQSLRACTGFEKHPIFVFGDGPRVESENTAVQETRKIAKDFLGDRATYFFSDTNKGLATSVIDGVTSVVGQFERVIVVEDDLLFHPQFLTYMDNALNRYASEENILSVSGYMYDTEELKGSKNAILLPVISTWGWGTWSRAWSRFDAESKGAEQLRTDKVLRKNFDCGNSYPFARMLERQLAGSVDSWGIRWYWTIFKNKGLTCFPPSTLVLNNGLDSSATHGRGLFTRFGKIKPLETLESKQPILFLAKSEFHPAIFKHVCNALYRLNGGFLGKVRDLIKDLLLKR
jgi:hypothetical protein